jgi:hypothetical protein
MHRREGLISQVLPLYFVFGVVVFENILYFIVVDSLSIYDWVVSKTWLTDFDTFSAILYCKFKGTRSFRKMQELVRKGHNSK